MRILRNRMSILLLAFAVVLSGCWDRKEPKNLAVVSSALYNLTEDGDFEITIEITSPSSKNGKEESSGGKAKSITYVGKEKNLSIPETARSISHSIDKSLFSSHTKVRFLSDKFARNDVTPVFDYILRSYHLDENPLIAVINDKDPAKVYECKIGLSETVGGYMDSIATSLPKITSKVVVASARDFIEDLYWDGKQPVLGTVQIKKDEAPSSEESEKPKKDSYKIEFEGLAAFKDAKLVGYMDGNEARSYNFVVNKLKATLVSIPNKYDFTTFMVDRSKSEIKTFVKDGEVSGKVSLNVYLSVIQQGGIEDVTKFETIKKLEQEINTLLEKEILDTIKKAQTEFKSDIFGFGIYMHIEHPEEWKKLKSNWDNEFSKADIEVEVDSSIRRTGQIKLPVRKEVE